MAAYVRNDDRFDDLRRALDVTDAESLNRFRRQVIEELDRSVDALGQGIETIVLSSEHLHTHLTQSLEVERLHTLLRRYGVPVEVVFYLRRQDRLATSLYSTHLKTMGTNRFALPPLGAESPFYNFELLLRRWADVFGADTIRVAVYDDVERTKGDFIDDFMEGLGITSLTAYSRKGRANVSISAEGQRFLRSANLAFSALGADTGRVALVNLLTSAMPGKGELPTRQEAEAFLTRFADGNEQVRKIWTPERPRLFDDDLSSYPAQRERMRPTLDATVAFARRLRERVEGDPILLDTLSRLVEAWKKGIAPVD